MSASAVLSVYFDYGKSSILPKTCIDSHQGRGRDYILMVTSTLTPSSPGFSIMAHWHTCYGHPLSPYSLSVYLFLPEKHQLYKDHTYIGEMWMGDDSRAIYIFRPEPEREWNGTLDLTVLNFLGTLLYRTCPSNQLFCSPHLSLCPLHSVIQCLHLSFRAPPIQFSCNKRIFLVQI